jgi:hypothetical protein
MHSTVNIYPVTFCVLTADKHEDFCLLGCNSSYKARNWATFVRNLLPSYLGLKMEATDFSENVVNVVNSNGRIW